jgi:hypothetical protein
VSHAAPDQDDELPEYVFGAFSDDGDDGDDDEQLRREDRRTKVIALTGLGVAFVIAVVAIVLVSFIDTSRPSVPGTPQAAAEQWGNAVVLGHTSQRQQLECAAGSESSGLLRLVVASASGVHAARVTHTGANRWRVTLNVDGIGDGARFPVVVIRDHGAYEVC